MPVNFLTEEQKKQYGKFYGELNETQLARYFHLDKTDLAFISSRRGSPNKIGVALQLTSVRFLGTFLPDVTLAPKNVKDFLVRQISAVDGDAPLDYAQRATTKREHNALIRKYYGYHEFNETPWAFRLSRILYSKAWINNERPSLMFDFATAWLLENKVLLPGVSTLSRLVAEIRIKADNRLWAYLSSLPSEAQKAKLELLLQVSEGRRISNFDFYRKGPTTISGPSFNEAIVRYLDLKDFDMGKLNFASIPPVRIKILARHAGIISMHKIARMPDKKRLAILVAFVKTFETIALDDALDVLDLLITNIAGKAKKLGEKNRLRSLKDLDKSALTLATVCSLILDDKIDGARLREAIFAETSKLKLQESVTIVHSLARPSDDKFHTEMVEQYGRVRRFLPRLLNDIILKSTPAGECIIDAFNYLATHDKSRKQTLENPPIDIIVTSWKRLVYDKDKQITRPGYTLCFIDKLQDALRRRDVYVKNSDRWGDPREKLLHDKDWLANRTQICRSIGHPLKPQTAIKKISSQLDTSYKQVAANLDKNDAVSIDLTGKYPSLTIKNLDKLDEPASLVLLRKNVTALLPKIDLTELLLEIHAHTAFLDEFTHVSESKARADNLGVSLCAVLIAEACNIGLEPLIKYHVPALERHRLSWVKQNYFRAETLIKANARLVDYQATLPLAKKWGGGEVASADGMRFVTPIKTINAGHNKKYYGTNKGITWYNFVSNQYSGFHGIAVPGTLRDSLFVLEGLLEQQTGLNPVEIITDTAGASDLIFGLFWLLGYQFSPRLADAGEAAFWRIDKDADYGSLDDLARGCVKTARIEQHWDDMLRVAGSLKLGTVHASDLIRTILKSDRPSGLAQAIIEAGRINKSLYLLNYINDEDYRRRILTQLNRGEGRHSVARAICHGQKGEIRKRYREGQEDQLGALGLVTNAVILWNTIYMQEAISYLQPSLEVRQEDEGRLCPLLHGHINVLGHYSFTLLEEIKNGRLRPLNELKS